MFGLLIVSDVMTTSDYDDHTDFVGDEKKMSDTRNVYKKLCQAQIYLGRFGPNALSAVRNEHD